MFSMPICNIKMFYFIFSVDSLRPLTKLEKFAHLRLSDAIEGLSNPGWFHCALKIFTFCPFDQKENSVASIQFHKDLLVVLFCFIYILLLIRPFIG